MEIRGNGWREVAGVASSWLFQEGQIQEWEENHGNWLSFLLKLVHFVFLFLGNCWASYHLLLILVFENCCFCWARSVNWALVGGISLGNMLYLEKIVDLAYPMEFWGVHVLLDLFWWLHVEIERGWLVFTLISCSFTMLPSIKWHMVVPKGFCYCKSRSIIYCNSLPTATCIRVHDRVL